MCPPLGLPCTPFIGQNPVCSADTGKATACTDSKAPLNQPTGPKTSDCQTLKGGIYNFTRAAVSGRRVDFYPLGGVPKKPHTFDLVQYMFAELCNATIGHNKNTDQCPGLAKGQQWVLGSPTSDITKITSDIKIGDFTHCDTIFHNIFRKLGFWGTFGLCMLIFGVCALGGFAGYKYYKKRKETQNYSVNDESIYHDVGSVVR